MNLALGLTRVNQASFWRVLSTRVSSHDQTADSRQGIEAKGPDSCNRQHLGTV